MVCSCGTMLMHNIHLNKKDNKVINEDPTASTPEERDYRLKIMNERKQKYKNEKDFEKMVFNSLKIIMDNNGNINFKCYKNYYQNIIYNGQYFRAFCKIINEEVDEKLINEILHYQVKELILIENSEISLINLKFLVCCSTKNFLSLFSKSSMIGLTSSWIPSSQ